MQEERDGAMNDEETMSMDDAGVANLNKPTEPGMPIDEPGMMDDPGMMAEPPLDESGMPVDEPPMLDDPGMTGEPDPDPTEPWLDMPQGVMLVPAPEGLTDPGTLEPHPLSQFMPVKSDSEYEALKESIADNGLQTPLTRFDGQILDGRHRLRACRELGIFVAVLDFVGSDDDALVYALSANQYHHEISKTQQATTAVRLLPDVSEMVKQGRLEKVRAAWERKRDGGCLPLMANNPGPADAPVSARVIVAAMMQGSNGYVGDAIRIQREAPELFEQMHAGQVSIKEALRQLDGEADDPERQQIKASRTQLNRILRRLNQHPTFLERWQAFLKEFPTD